MILSGIFIYAQGEKQHTFLAIKPGMTTLKTSVGKEFAINKRGNVHGSAAGLFIG